MARLIRYIDHAKHARHNCFVGNKIQDCKLGLFQDASFAGDLHDEKSTSGGVLCVFASHTFVPMSWMCKKHTAVSHSGAESEIVPMYAGMGGDGIPALHLWDCLKNHVRMLMLRETFSAKRHAHSVDQLSFHMVDHSRGLIRMICTGRSPRFEARFSHSAWIFGLAS